MSASSSTAMELAQTESPPPRQRVSLAKRIEYAEQLAQANLLPSAYRGRPANVLLAMETGDMLGLAPMAAISNIHIIDGKPTMGAGLMAALVRRAGHRVRVTGGDKQAVCSIWRSDDPEFEYRSEWTIERAKQAELLRKDVWRKYPAAMLKARATSEVCRDACPEIFLGPIYVPEELGALVDGDGEPVEGELIGSGEQAAAAQLDWDADRTSLAGDADGLRKLWQLAKNHGAPDDVLGRIQADGEAAKNAATGAEDGVDWEHALAMAEGDADALRQLWADATDAELPQEFMDRVMAAGRQAKDAPEVVDAELVDDGADPERDVVACDGSRQVLPEGDMTITDRNGREWALCPGCTRYAPIDSRRAFIDHEGIEA